MDGYHAALAAGGLLVGIWLKSGSHEPDLRPCVCHCAVTPTEKGSGESFWLCVGLVGLLGLLATSLALAFRVSFRRDEAGLREFSFSCERQARKRCLRGA